MGLKNIPIFNMRIKKIHFHYYKTFKDFTVNLSEFDVLVGPNNAGKSTILGALRILSEGIRKANVKKAEYVNGPSGKIWGYLLDLNDIPVSLENVFYNYNDKQPAKVSFYLDNKTWLTLFFPKKEVCFLIPEGAGTVHSPLLFKRNYPIKVGFVPVLGPVEHIERMYKKEAARKALLTHGASRNFRNIWYHYPDGFKEFKEKIQSTWPGMDINPPEIVLNDDKEQLIMFCPEERVPREIYWAGFGFQVWCQMLTYILQAKDSTIFIIDEPDIYLHSDLQRQLVDILQGLGAQIVLATHSLEIITEVESCALLTIHKKRKHATRISNPRDIQAVYQLLGSNANPILTQLSKTRRVLFIEGKDFQIISLFARKLKYNNVANRTDFAVVSVDGFRPQAVKDFSKGVETTIGLPVMKCSIFDRDYRSDDEINKIQSELKKVCEFVFIHRRKEIENFLLNPKVLDRAIRDMIQKKYSGTSKMPVVQSAENILEEIAENHKNETLSQYLAHRRKFIKPVFPGTDDAVINSEVLKEFEEEWKTLNGRLRLIPGKEVVSNLNKFLQDSYNISLTHRIIVNTFTKEDMDNELVLLLEGLDRFSELELVNEKK